MIDRLRSTLSRDVFRFDGTANEFRAALAEAGFSAIDSAPIEREAGPFLSGIIAEFPSRDDLMIFSEFDGHIWIAARIRDIDDARRGELPFEVIASLTPQPVGPG